MTVGAEAIARFTRDLASLANGLVPSREQPLALAVSGGPDSMAMLALADGAFHGTVIAATVDHGLRAEASDEAAMVAAYCRDIGISHAILTPKRGWLPKTVQADARHIRYSLLGDWALAAGACAILTAHHADDQAETFLMRAARGSGVAGLGGIRARWLWERRRWHQGYPKGGVVAVADIDCVPVIRPLLGWRRAELAFVVEAAGTPFAADPSNADDRYDRVRMRALLTQHSEFDALQLAQAAAACAEADRAIAAMLLLLRHERMREDDVYERAYDVTDLPRELRRRLARDAIGYVREVQGIKEGRWSDATNVEALLDALETGNKATLAGVLASAKGDLWTFVEAPPRRGG